MPSANTPAPLPANRATDCCLYEVRPWELRGV